jgi:hypothetical protein
MDPPPVSTTEAQLAAAARRARTDLADLYESWHECLSPHELHAIRVVRAALLREMRKLSSFKPPVKTKVRVRVLRQLSIGSPASVSALNVSSRSVIDSMRAHGLISGTSNAISITAYGRQMLATW